MSHLGLMAYKCRQLLALALVWQMQILTLYKNNFLPYFRHVARQQRRYLSFLLLIDLKTPIIYL